MTALRASVAGLTVLLLALAFPAGSVRAGLGFFYDVTSLADTVVADGACTLREAITSANGSTTADCGRGSSGEAGIGFSVDGTIVLSSPLPTITNDTGIDGTGRTVAISGNSTVDILSVSSTTLWLTKLTIANGLTGLINTNGIVNVSGSLFVGNSTRAIANDQGTLAVTESRFSRNGTSRSPGGAIENIVGALTVFGSTFVRNLSQRGGAVSTYFGTATISMSTFARNESLPADGQPGEGGAIYMFGQTATLAVANGTFIGNAAVEGGALAVSGGALTVTNSTFVGNTADKGAVLWVTSADTDESGSATLGNTILVGSAPACVRSSTGTILDGGGNISWPDTSCPGMNVDPQLDAGLRNNGGATPTVGLRWSSPAIDAGTAATCRFIPINDRDQRGGIRPVDGDRDGVARCDIGAFEYGGLIPPAPRLVSATMVTGGEKLVWSRARDALRYRVEVRKAGILVATRNTTTTVTRTIPLATGSYTWTVQACNTLGCERSLVGSFTR